MQYITLILALVGASYFLPMVEVPSDAPRTASAPVAEGAPETVKAAAKASDLPEGPRLANPEFTGVVDLAWTPPAAPARFARPVLAADPAPGRLPAATALSAPGTRSDDAQVAAANPAPEEQSRDLRAVRANVLNMRAGPSTQYPVVAVLTNGDRTVVVDENGSGWVQIRTGDNQREGWVFSRYLDPVEGA